MIARFLDRHWSAARWLWLHPTLTLLLGPASVMAGIAALLLLASCEPPWYVPPEPAARLTPDQARDLIHEEAERDWCRAEVDGTPLLRRELYGELCL
jgi:hypothetical protein